MANDKGISIFDFAAAISEAVDLVAPALNNHHRKVANISCSIALAMDLPKDGIREIVLAALLHDIGAFSTEERIEMLQIESFGPGNNKHALLGYKLLKAFQPMAKAAALIKHHHADFSKSGDSVPLGSYIIGLADRIAVWYKEDSTAVCRVSETLGRVRENEGRFHPEVLSAFKRLVGHEYFIMETFSPSLSTVSMKKVPFQKVIVDMETLKSFAKVIAQIIDFRSRFTATHSSGVAAVASELAGIVGFSEKDCKLMEIAGYLHDVGKLAVPNDILEKKGALDDEEYSIVKRHAYYTYAILDKIDGLENIAAWAAFHHERQDGNGYPFHIKDEDFCMFSRVMAVADILTALTEDRPYREGMGMEKAGKVLFEMADKGCVDRHIVEVANRNIRHVNNVRIRAQKKALHEYEEFHSGLSAHEADMADREQYIS